MADKPQFLENCGLPIVSPPRRLRGGVKIRASEFLGGGGTPPIIAHSPPPATASRSHPPPQAAEGKNSFFVKKRIPIPAQAGMEEGAGMGGVVAVV